MKRTAAAFVLVAGLGGCVSPDAAKKTALKSDKPESARVMQADHRASESMPRQGTRAVMNVAPGGMADPAVQQVAGFRRIVGAGCEDCGTGAGGIIPPSLAGRGPGYADMPLEAYGPRQGFFSTMAGGGGILPAPGMGPWGAVAGVGMGGPGMGGPGMFANQRTSIRFAAPGGMKIAFQDPAKGFAEAGREAPVRYNFPQGSIYRLRLSGIPNRPGKNYYPTLEVYPTTLKTVTFLSHSTVPIGFSDEDFEQVNAGNLVVKVVYLPDPAFQDLAAAEEIVSTRLEPGVDPITEANRRGTILAVIRIGNIDLEDPSTPAMDAPPAGMPGPGMLMPPPRMVPGGPMIPPGPGGPAGPGGPGGPGGNPMPMPNPKPMKPSGSADSQPSRVPSTLPPLSVPTLSGN